MTRRANSSLCNIFACVSRYWASFSPPVKRSMTKACVPGGSISSVTVGSYTGFIRKLEIAVPQNTHIANKVEMHQCFRAIKIVRVQLSFRFSCVGHNFSRLRLGGNSAELSPLSNCRPPLLPFRCSILNSSKFLLMSYSIRCPGHSLSHASCLLLQTATNVRRAHSTDLRMYSRHRQDDRNKSAQGQGKDNATHADAQLVDQPP